MALYTDLNSVDGWASHLNVRLSNKSINELF